MDTMIARAHIINHTHWDREWFLTSIYTSQWLPGLIDKLAELSKANPEFRFLLDGQTLVIEDLLATAPEYRTIVQDLIQNGHLIIGPYYCQPDWQLTDGETLIRNLRYGQADVERHGGENRQTGWLVDTFGHISQAPQLHTMFGIDTVFVWRGVPQLVPYFNWVSSSGQEVLAVNLFGGYRNLYGITHAPEIAMQRLISEVNKLQPYFPTPDIPLFDGYDLEDNPEDPVRFYQQHTGDLPLNLEIKASTPRAFANTVRQTVEHLPRLTGELNSGKYGATFPGTFSTRTYLKVLARDCTYWLYQVCEPLGVLARLKSRVYPTEQYETWSRMLLQNAVHDCICGVSIDQVHEKMEHAYRKVFEGVESDIRQSLAYILRDFTPGTYAVSTNPFPYTGWHFAEDMCYRVQTNGIGVWPVKETTPVVTPHTLVETFQWKNDYYTAYLNADGSVQIGDAVLGRFRVSKEKGDTYSDELGPSQGFCQLTAVPIIEQQSDIHCILRYPCSLAWEGVTITATVRLIFEQSPLVRWQIDLDSQGTDFRVDMIFEAPRHGSVLAGMPFDIIQRPTADSDLLPRELEPPLAEVLLGQRELVSVNTFPFHDFIAITDHASAIAIFAQGIHTYQADDQGQIAITLRRSVEWLTKANLARRVGDAGPFFYVPDARCERHVRHELAAAVGDLGADTTALQHLNTGFQNPPLIVKTHTAGAQTEWSFLQENLPMSSLQFGDRHLLACFYNPTEKPVALSQAFQATDVWGQPTHRISTVAPKDIVTLALDYNVANTQIPPETQAIELISAPRGRVGDNHGLPDRATLEQLNEHITDLEKQVQRIETQLEQAASREYYLLKHQYYVKKRELYEYRLSLHLNQLKLAAQGQVSEAYLYNPDSRIAEIGFQLNQLRIKRRIFDYIVGSLGTAQE